MAEREEDLAKWWRNFEVKKQIVEKDMADLEE